MYLYKDNDIGLRVVEKSDLELLANHRNDMETTAHLTSPLPVWPHDQKKWFNSLGGDNLYFIAERNGFPVGLTRITDINWVNRNALVGLDIFQGYRGKGLGHLVFKMVVDYCFNTLNMYRLWLMVAENNVPAYKIYKKSGFKIEGTLHHHLFKNGEYTDYIVMGLLKDER